MKTQGQLTVIEILRLSNGWYDFKNVPQGYIKVHAVHSGSDENALRQAVRLNPSFDIDYQIVNAQ